MSSHPLTVDSALGLPFVCLHICIYASSLNPLGATIKFLNIFFACSIGPLLDLRSPIYDIIFLNVCTASSSNSRFCLRRAFLIRDFLKDNKRFSSKIDPVLNTRFHIPLRCFAKRNSCEPSSSSSPPPSVASFLRVLSLPPPPLDSSSLSSSRHR